MTINIEYETDKELKLDYENIINRVINEAVDYAKCPYEAEVNVTLTDNDEIKKINGTGDGEMDYTIGFVNDEGEYNDLRRFEDIDINKDTVIDTVANTSKKTLLNIDEDGDGKYDLKLQAGVNGYGEEVKIDRGIYIILAYAFISALIITIIVRKISI